jgi:hypothetical protein
VSKETYYSKDVHGPIKQIAPHTHKPFFLFIMKKNIKDFRELVPGGQRCTWPPQTEIAPRQLGGFSCP